MDMKQQLIQILFIVGVFGIVTGCFEAPEFPEEPRIEYLNIEFKEFSEADSLYLTFEIRDGDGDIGLANEEEDDNDSRPPYHPFSILLDNDPNVDFVIDDPVALGDTDLDLPLTSRPASPITYFVDLLKYDPNSGQASLSRELFTSYLGPASLGPPSAFPGDASDIPTTFDCEDFEIIDVHFIEEDSFNVDGVVFYNQNLRVRKDTAFVLRNETHNNIYLDFYRKVNGEFRLIDFIPGDCSDNFNGRFPVFKRSGFGKPLEGRITYAMQSVAFPFSFRNDTIQIEFFIYDRNLNRSNIARTPGFVLSDITR